MLDCPFSKVAFSVVLVGLDSLLMSEKLTSFESFSTCLRQHVLETILKFLKMLDGLWDSIYSRS